MLVSLGIHFHIISVGIGRENAGYGVCTKPFLRNDFLQHRLCIIKEFRCFGAALRIFQNFNTFTISQASKGVQSIYGTSSSIGKFFSTVTPGFSGADGE